MLPDINTISEQQAHQTHNIEAEIKHFLHYASNHPTVLFLFKSSDMVLHIDSDL